ncbi:hypothetical protein [Thorsellia anophelis]|uniref:Uncharacterized protein n=1 Tax=Thorsellia anophelis DSM 18579 TaxID=1123402 RepID=A0A1I0EHE2_9GAMM|nr:hypothetical protein [Thorsellia anophelis]SET44724.1 hypothetical protein SAMN02583745_02384 [Thorsellia anophelis DSM 18579]
MQAIIGFIILANILYSLLFVFFDSLTNKVEERTAAELIALEKNDYIDDDVIDRIESALEKTGKIDVSISLEDALDDNSLVKDYKFNYSEYPNGGGIVYLEVFFNDGTTETLECAGVDKRFYRNTSLIGGCESSNNFYRLYESKYL